MQLNFSSWTQAESAQSEPSRVLGRSTDAGP